jgi:bifunctional polynucleotide phosphatase/kinase
MDWEKHNTLLIGKYKLKSVKRKKIAGFDIDHTLIKPKDGKKFPTDENDWEFTYPNVTKKLKKYHKNGYQLAFVTTQKRSGKTPEGIQTIKNKFDMLVKAIDEPIILFASLGDDMYRKPRPGIQKAKHITFGPGSFFVGDAAGRPNRNVGNKHYKKDFANTDYKFAANVGAEFRTPDYEFTEHNDLDLASTEYLLPFDDLAKIMKNTDGKQLFKPKRLEMVLMYGLPASGKSSFVRDNILPHDYVYVNQDTLKTEKKCIELAKEAIENKKNLVIDNTNLSKEKRGRFIALINGSKYKVRLLMIETPLEVCKHNSIYRNYRSDNNIDIISKMVYNIMLKKKNTESPQKNEGIDKIEKIQYHREMEDDYYLYMS